MCEVGAFEDWKVELVDGELERMPPAGNEHGRRHAMLVTRLSRVVAEELLRVEAGVDLGSDTVLGCDGAILIAPIEGVGNRMLRPDEVRLTVEIAETTLSRDLGMKRRKYAAAGIENYWVVDSGRGVVHVHAGLQNGVYADERPVPFGQPIPVPGTDATITID